MKKSLLPLLFFGSFALAQSNLVSSQTLADATLESNGKKKTLIEKIKEKELELQVPRETVPVPTSNYPIKTSIPKTAYYLPMLQTLLHIEPGTLPNPIGFSVIGSYTVETYRVKKFKGQMGANLGSSVSSGVNDALTKIQSATSSVPTIQTFLNDGSLFGYQTKILGQTVTTAGLITAGNGCKTESGLCTATDNREAFFSDLATTLNNAFGTGEKEWELSDGTIRAVTGAVGGKFDIYLFPFMNLFVTAAYIRMEQETNVGTATIPLDNPLVLSELLDGRLSSLVSNTTISSVSFNVGSIKNILNGYVVMGGTNLAIGYKGFFASCMLSGGYVQLDDWQNNVKGFVQKPLMYIAPRVGYTYEGIFTMHVGVQRIELFGSTKGKDLSASTGGLVQGYSVELDKFPVNFLAGAQFMPMRDFGISIEYVGSPDTSGVNAEIAYRF
ncbi:hypothetical protein [Helicobacter brantae]|uniref:Autotransporter domain-containing protein n=1 Tax=Helicobacter brantae TaxID=375927 RepID=A0A3D8J099_9HELI|nr:hypothetical protein [Helicobacter brantae]RDU70918.1 hypothetical protein CQA58_03840 [Helicobacter brantae]